MTKIQIVVVFTKLNNLSNDIQKRMQQIVVEEYARTFGCLAETVQTTLHEGTSDGKNTDIHLFIDSDEKHYNEGALRMEMRKTIAGRFRLLLPGSLGFNGVITASDGTAKVLDQQASNESTKRNREFDTVNAGDPAEVEKRSQMYEAVSPKYTFDMVQLPEDTIEQINRALGRIEHEKKVFEEWGLYAIMPNPVSALGFFGPPGTGKTLAAEAIADKMGKKIIRVSYADIENKYVGEGPKNVKAVFYAAEKQDALLFIDEADSLLSKRLTSVSDGTGQAFNSMRSQLLMSLENFHGIAIFATNLVVNYDKAFLSRLISVEFKSPDATQRQKIWETHLLPKYMNGRRLAIPLSKDVNITELAEKFDLCGRDIRNAVIDACVEACQNGKDCVDQECLRFGAQARMDSNNAIEKASDYTSVSSKDSVAKLIENKMEKGKIKKVSIKELDEGEENE